MNTVQKGKSSEFLAISKLLKKGYSVFSSVAEDSLVDLVYMESSGKLQKAQVKSFYSGSKGEYHFKTIKNRTNSKIYSEIKYTKEFIDVFLAVDLLENEVYIIPVEFTEKYKSTISLSKIKENFIPI